MIDKNYYNNIPSKNILNDYEQKNLSNEFTENYPMDSLNNLIINSNLDDGNSIK